jgi:hypothetical protein
MNRVIATGAAVAALLVAGGATSLVAPALACGDTPGFCPNPPTATAPAQDWPVGVDGDF